MHANLCDLIVDLAQNAIEAEAAEITLSIEEKNSQLNVVIADNGKGMGPEVLKKVRDPFYTDGIKHAHRKVGLGLPFLFQTAEMTEGTADIQSTEGAGTTVTLQLDLTHVDLPPFGNLVTALSTLLSYATQSNLIIERTWNSESYRIERNELIEVLGDLTDTDSLILLRQYLESCEEALRAG